jgi:biotin carboxyl carrier protein
MSSPDQLDQVMRVTSPRSWLALAGFAAVVLAAVLWGFLGTVPRTVSGQGILTRPGGVSRVVATSPGLVAEIGVRSGDAVQQGQVIAWLEGTPRPPTSPTAQGVDPQARGERIPVTSSSAGHVIEVLTRAGDFLPAGAPVISLDPPERAMTAYLYLPVGPGKQVQPGMTAQVSPSTVQSEQYGFLIGQVRSVSEFPVTQRGIQRLLENEELVQQFLSRGPVIEVTVDLVEDPNTASGLKWSSPQGPPIEISPGTTAAGAVVLDEVRPIELVVPGAVSPSR